LHLIEVPANDSDRTLTGAVWYPCSAPTQDIAIESRVITAAKDCSIVGNKLPLIVVSHGRAGWFGGHHSTAAAIADAGFVVAAISHPGDNMSDRSRVDDLSALAQRPADVERLVDFMLASYVDALKLDKERIGFFGFSMGGYTGLVILGAVPDFKKGLPGCAGSEFLACKEIEQGGVPIIAPVHDPRIKTAVIVDPGPGIFFPAESLRGVRAPIQLWSSDPKLGSSFVSGCCAIGIKGRLPSPPEYHLITNAIHFSFLPPCSAAESRQFPRICTDAPGFDRSAFHKDFEREVIVFLRKHLPEQQKQ
jgi:predicted dienelactone hydrolase